MEDWDSISKKISDMLGSVGKRVEEISDGITEAFNKFAKSEEFQRFVEILNSIPDDVQKTVLFQKCQQLSKKDLTFEEVEWLFDEFEISTMEKAMSEILKYIDSGNALHNYIKNVMESTCYGNREKLIIILAHFERLIYLTLRREKKRNEPVKTMCKEELVKKNHGIDSENIYKIVLLAITNVVFANTDDFTSVDKRLPFRNNILHRGIIDYTDEEVDIAYKTLLIFVAHIIQMNGFLSPES